VVKSDNNQVALFTISGMQLVGSQAGSLSFDAQGTMTPQAKWSSDPSQRTVGTISLTTPNGAKIDMIAGNAIRSGEIAGYLSMRDQVLPQAQDQLDQFAASIASALSDQRTAGTAVAGPPAGFDVDAAPLSSGNAIDLTYSDIATGAARKLTFVRVDDSSLAGKTADPDVFNIDFSGGMASVVSQMNTALAGTGVTVSNPAGSTVEFVDDGTSTATVDAAGATATATSIMGSVNLPLFTDGTSAYTGKLSAFGPQSSGFAARIAVNAGIVADPSKLIGYQAGVDAADAARPDFIYNQMAISALSYSPSAGIGSVSAPFSGTPSAYLSQMISFQGTAAGNASQLQQGQDMVLAALQQRFSDGASVNIDQEMGNLLNLQNSYAANARVMSAVRDMLSQLLQI
jgi:flagellar hook-associated protein 1 FlgK